MSASFRPALLFCAALSASSIAPAQAGPSQEPLLPVQSAVLPRVAVPQLLDPSADAELTAPSADQSIDRPVTVAPSIVRSADLSDKVAQFRAAEAGSRELDCLATGVYFESKSEPLAGQLAVAQVIANRAQSGGRFPGSYCGVLFQRGQFSFIHGRGLPSVPRASRQWQNAVAIARIVDKNLHVSSVGKALFFHARYVSPRWRLKRVAAIGNHIFYR